MRRVAAVAVLAAISLPAPAYYHFINYLNGVNAPEKFDLTALPNGTVTFFVSENGPTTYSATDTFNSVVSQIRGATVVWNGVATSALRVAFGGLENTSTLQNTPGGDVVFEDLPPGLLGYGGPTSLASPVTVNGSTFLPVLRSAVHLNRNLTIAPGPSFNDSFFMTCVHEMGHALGLQHTFTSSTMSTATTRATTRTRPIDVDDIAGLSILYPTPSFPSQFGSITGRITNGSSGVHLASVVAIRAGAGAISALSNPDGTFRIDGIPVGSGGSAQYLVYAHPLPPDADIKGPWNADGTVAAASGPTNALFYPGTTNVSQASPVTVQAGTSAGGINISLASRPYVEIYDAGVYGYFSNNSVAVKPAYVDSLAGNTTVVASGAGLGSNGQAPGLGVQFIGGFAQIQNGGVRPYAASGYTYVALDIGFSLFPGVGQQHVVFTTSDFMSVLPAGIILTQQPPPAVTAISANGDGTATVTGTNWNSDSLIYFDGLPATISSLDTNRGVAVVTPPVGASGQISTLTVYNSDGQNSQFLESASPVTFSYPSTPAPIITAVSPSSLPAGAEAMLDITTNGFAFSTGQLLSSQVAVGFGTTDIVVRRVFVLSPNHLQADVSVASGAALSNPDVSIVSGFQMATAPAGFQIVPAVAGLPAVIPVLTNALAGLNGAYPGAAVQISGSNLAVLNANPVVTIAGQPTGILSATPTQLVVQIPPGAPLGPALLTLNNGQASAYPVLVNIDPAPAGIASVQNLAGTNVDGTHPAHAGDQLVVNMTNFAPAGTVIAQSRVQVAVGGLMHNILQVVATPSGGFQVVFALLANEPTGSSQQLVVYLDGHSSYPTTIPVAHPDGTF